MASIEVRHNIAGISYRVVWYVDGALRQRTFTEPSAADRFCELVERSGPARYVDPVAVERAASGLRVRVTPRERRAAIQQLTRLGLSDRDVTEGMGISTRTVSRARCGGGGHGLEIR
jgi:DNA-binding NarL/FixJ family response regulator